MPNWRKVIVSGSDAALNTLIVSNGITGSLLGTATTASFVTGSNVFGPFGSNSIISASFALTSSYSPNLVISGSIANVDYIDFNTGSATPPWKSGRVYWDNTDGALAVYNAEADITLQVGQESWVRVFNEGTTITNGTAVRIIGSHGDMPLIVRAQASQVSGSALGDNQIIGIATHTIETNSIGYVTTQGLVRGLNTNAFTDGDLLFVSSSAGVITNVIPQAPYEVIQVGICVKAGPGGSGIIFCFPTQPIDFGDLASAERGTYQYGDIWSYQQTGSVGVWKHGRSLSGSYSITGSLNVTGGITGSLFGTASYANVAALGGFVQDGNSFGALATLGTNDNQSLAIETNGTTKMFVSSSGNVGIGTTAPDYPLHINRDTTNNYIQLSGNTNKGLFAAGAGLLAFDTSGNFRIYTGGVNERVIVDNTGRIGIGTTSPSEKLHIEGTSNPSIRLYNPTHNGNLMITSYAGGLVYLTNAYSLGKLGFGTNSRTNDITIDKDGLVGIGTASPAYKLDVSGSISISKNAEYYYSKESGGGSVRMLGINEGNTAYVGAIDPGPTSTIFNASSTSLTAAVYTSGTEKMRIDSVGNVGIGTTTPSQKLDVNGDTIITGSLITSGSTGAGINTSTQYLIDTNGVTSLDWNQRILYDGSATISSAWGSRKLYDSAGADALSWRNRILYDSSTSSSINWESRRLLSTGGSKSLNWVNDTYLTSGVYQQDIKATTTQDAASIGPPSTDTYLGDIIEGVVSTVTPPVDGQLCYLSTAGKWETYNHPATGSYGQMVGLVFNVNGAGGTCQVLLEGHALVVDNGSSGEPLIENTTYGAPVYIRSGSINGEMSTIIPSSGIVQVLGHCYYPNTTNTDYWMMKFKPSPDWVEL